MFCFVENLLFWFGVFLCVWCFPPLSLSQSPSQGNFYIPHLIKEAIFRIEIKPTLSQVDARDDKDTKISNTEIYYSDQIGCPKNQKFKAL